MAHFDQAAESATKFRDIARRYSKDYTSALPRSIMDEVDQLTDFIFAHAGRTGRAPVGAKQRQSVLSSASNN